LLNLTANALKVFLALDPCDMRKSFNGLQQLAADQLGSAPNRSTGATQEEEFRTLTDKSTMSPTRKDFSKWPKDQLRWLL
jgi:hypothetical protein